MRHIPVHKICFSYITKKTYLRAEFDEATARETLALGAKAVTADVAHTAVRARVNFMVNNIIDAD